VVYQDVVGVLVAMRVAADQDLVLGLGGVVFDDAGACECVPLRYYFEDRREN
jgi:hypothetical protein